MRLFTTVAFLFAMICTPLQAHAWGAVAASSPTNNTFSSTGHDTAAAAENAAIAGCEKWGEACKLVLDGARHGGAFVTYEGDGGKGFGYDLDPVKANKKAQASCQSSYKNCRLVSAAWDEGGGWMALARGSDATGLVYNSAEKSDAEKVAVELCEKDVSDKGSCRAYEPFTQFGQVYIATAVSERSKYAHRAISGKSQRAADADSLKGCADNASDPGDCVVRERAINEGPKPAPKSMQKLVASIKKPAPAPASRPVAQGRSYSCKTSCTNNSCMSRFPDGKIIRWTAPMVFEFGQWKADMSSCGLK